MVVPDNRRNNDKIRKLLFKFFKRLGFVIEVDINQKVAQYLDVELNLQNNNVSPYIKHNSILKYVNAGFNHPKSVIMLM